MKKLSILHRMEQGKKCLIGMIHCLPLPGTENYGGSVEEIYEKALTDAQALEKVGFDAVIVENTCDLPFARRLERQQIAVLAGVGRSVVQALRIPVGVNASFSDTGAALAIAYAAGAQFVRSPVFVDSVHVTGLGLVEPSVGDIQRMRRLLRADDIAVFADVQVKHSHLANPEVQIEESAQIAQECGANALIVTGVSTGKETPIETVRRTKSATSLPVLIGSGFSAANAKEQLAVADGAIVGSALKLGGVITAPVDEALCRRMLDAIAKGAKT